MDGADPDRWHFSVSGGAAERIPVSMSNQRVEADSTGVSAPLPHPHRENREEEEEMKTLIWRRNGADSHLDHFINTIRLCVSAPFVQLFSCRHIF